MSDNKFCIKADETRGMKSHDVTIQMKTSLADRAIYFCKLKHSIITRISNISDRDKKHKRHNGVIRMWAYLKAGWPYLVGKGQI